jgi:two-component system, NtrC family, sensor histidine kinase HydH
MACQIIDIPLNNLEIWSFLNFWDSKPICSCEHRSKRGYFVPGPLFKRVKSIHMGEKAGCLRWHFPGYKPLFLTPVLFLLTQTVMTRNNQKKKPWLWVPPWVVIGAVLVLAPIFFFLTVDSINRQKENTIALLREKGAALIRSFEAGARTGMMGMRWGGTQVQRLLSETAQQKDIAYILVTDAAGTILADSDPVNIGNPYGESLDLLRISQSHSLHWREVHNGKGKKIFEVFRQFVPMRGVSGGHGQGMGSGDWCRRHMSPPRKAADRGSQVIFVGLDMTSVEDAAREDIRHSIFLGFIFLLIGFAGIVTLFMAQAYRSAKSSFSRVKAFSDNLVENMPMGLIAIDQEERIASFNQTAESMLGISAHEALGKGLPEILPASFQDFFERLKSESGPINRELKASLGHERILPLEVIGTALTAEDGAPLGWVILFRDLTEIQHLKREIARSQRLASIGRLAAGVAHEIRNPLSSIKGFATYFKERYRDTPKDHQTAEIMIQEVERLNRVIGQLLEFARPMSIQRRATQLDDLIRHSLKMVEGDAKQKGVTLNVESDPHMETVQIDPDRIKQVLLNLYLNAMEAMEEGGDLSVAFLGMPANHSIQITVSDTGPGIKPEDLPNLFDPYFTTKPSGTGLGLAIVHKIIESHEGEIQVESLVGEGTTITMVIPHALED